RSLLPLLGTELAALDLLQLGNGLVHGCQVLHKALVVLVGPMVVPIHHGLGRVFRLLGGFCVGSSCLTSKGHVGGPQVVKPEVSEAFLTMKQVGTVYSGQLQVQPELLCGLVHAHRKTCTASTMPRQHLSREYPLL